VDAAATADPLDEQDRTDGEIHEQVMGVGILDIESESDTEMCVVASSRPPLPVAMSPVMVPSLSTGSMSGVTVPPSLSEYTDGSAWKDH
jgi:hypothetical protein